jgi:hypothetical protein
VAAKERDDEAMDAWERVAVGRHGVPVLQQIERLKARARRLAGRNDRGCFLLLLEERILNDLVVDLTSAWLDMERVASHIATNRYKVGTTQTSLYRAIVA